MAAKKDLKINYYGLCTKCNVFRKCQGKIISLNLKLVRNKIKLTSSNCYLIFCCCCCLNLPPVVVGWYIMGYESEPLPSYNKLRNRSYSIKKNKKNLRLILIFLYHVFIPPYHHTDCPQPTLRLGIEPIDVEACHLFRDGCLSSPNLLLYRT